METNQESVMDQALGLARGSYQRDLVLGHESWAGSTLRGHALKFTGRYRESRENLLNRITSAGLGDVFRGRRNRAVLLLGAQVEHASQALVAANSAARAEAVAALAEFRASIRLAATLKALETTKDGVVELTDEGVVPFDLPALKDAVWEAAVAARTTEGLLKEAKAAEVLAWRASWDAIEEAEEVEP